MISPVCSKDLSEIEVISSHDGAQSLEILICYISRIAARDFEPDVGRILNCLAISE